MKSTTLLMIAAVFIGMVGTGYSQQSTSKTACRPYGESEFRLGPGDVIQVVVYKEAELSVDGLPVRPDGKISLPWIGELLANGKTTTQLEVEITKRLTEFVAIPKVNVVVK